MPTLQTTPYNYGLTNPQKGIWSYTKPDMINPQKGIWSYTKPDMINPQKGI
jgi:hypothetical protein